MQTDVNGKEIKIGNRIEFAPRDWTDNGKITIIKFGIVKSLSRDDSGIYVKPDGIDGELFICTKCLTLSTKIGKLEPEFVKVISWKIIGLVLIWNSKISNRIRIERQVRWFLVISMRYWPAKQGLRLIC